MQKILKRIPDLRFPEFRDERQVKIARLFNEALNKTLEKEIDILERGRSERLFASKLACYLQLSLDASEFADHNLRSDANYNKHFPGSKKVGANLIEVDIAVHQRGVDLQNLLVVELETSNSPNRDDIWKLREMTKNSGEYSYVLGVYVALGVEKEAGKVITEEWYVNGTKK